jgi:predicted alpha/beta superfamily hydrolase
MSFRKVSLISTETRLVRSMHTGRKYELSIGLPYDYAEIPRQKWPVLYLLDANFYFGMVTEMVRSMAVCGGSRDAVVVGIGYLTQARGLQAWRQVMAWRSKDLTPTRDVYREEQDSKRLEKRVQTGGGAKFLSFLETELLPMVGKNYRVDPGERTLVGHSYGGLFALYTMLHKPRLFQRYVASSPGLHHNQRKILAFEADFARRRKTLPAHLFMTIGELEENQEFEGVSNFYRFCSQIESRGYQGFTLIKKLFHGEDHCTAASLGLRAGIRNTLQVK